MNHHHDTPWSTSAPTLGAVLVLATLTAPTASAAAHPTSTPVLVQPSVPRQHICPLWMSPDRPTPCLSKQLAI